MFLLGLFETDMQGHLFFLSNLFIEEITEIV